MPQFQIWNLRTREKRVIEAEHSHLVRELTGWPVDDVQVLPVELGKNAPVDELWSLKKFCNFFGLSKTTSYGLLQDGAIPSYKDKREYRIKAADALDWWMSCNEMAHLDAVLLSRMYMKLPADKKKQLMAFAEELSS